MGHFGSASGWSVSVGCARTATQRAACSAFFAVAVSHVPRIIQVGRGAANSGCGRRRSSVSQDGWSANRVGMRGKQAI